MPDCVRGEAAVKPVPQGKRMSKTKGFGILIGLVTAAASTAGCTWFGSYQGSPDSASSYDSSVGCPAIILREGAHLKQEFHGNSEGIMEKLIFQTTVNSWSNLCRRESNRIRMKVSLTGRIVTGPAWKSRAVKFPVHFTISHADSTEYAAGKWNVVVGLEKDNISMQWSVSDESILLPGNAESMRVFISLQDK